MRRLVLVPLVVAPVAAAAAALWIGGLVWPIAVTFYRVIAPQPATEHTELDPL